MGFDDLRGFIAAAEALGELQRLDGAHWDLEIGALTEIQAERRGPALLFDRIADAPPGYRVLSNGFATARRTALALNLPLDLGPVELANAGGPPEGVRQIPPVEVADAPVLQNVRRGADIDLGQFPTPRWHEKDGGRYLATGCAVIVRDPDEGWVNWAPTAARSRGPTVSPCSSCKASTPASCSTSTMPAASLPRGRLARPRSRPLRRGHSPRPWGVSEYEFVAG